MQIRLDDKITKDYQSKIFVTPLLIKISIKHKTQNEKTNSDPIPNSVKIRTR